MSEHIQRAIEEFEATIVKLTDTIEKLRWFQREFPHTAAAIERVEPRRTRTRKAKAAKRKPKRAPAVSRRDARSLPDDVETAMQAALQKRSPQKPSELAAGLKVSNFVVNARLKALEKRGIVKLTGATFSRQAHLVEGKPAPTAGPKPNGSMKKQAAPASAIDQVEELDDTVLSTLKAAGRTGRSLREMQISHSEATESALMRSLTRLKVKQKAVVDDSGRWTAV